MVAVESYAQGLDHRESRASALCELYGATPGADLTAEVAHITLLYPVSFV